MGKTYGGCTARRPRSHGGAASERFPRTPEGVALWRRVGRTVHNLRGRPRFETRPAPKYEGWKGFWMADASPFFPGDPDWTWQYPWKRRMPNPSKLDLVLEALRRAVELRDTALEGGDDGETARKAHMLVSVLNPLFEKVLAEALPPDTAVVGYEGTAFEQVADLRANGLLPPEGSGR